MHAPRDFTKGLRPFDPILFDPEIAPRKVHLAKKPTLRALPWALYPSACDALIPTALLARGIPTTLTGFAVPTAWSSNTACAPHRVRKPIFTPLPPRRRVHRPRRKAGPRSRGATYALLTECPVGALPNYLAHANTGFFTRLAIVNTIKFDFAFHMDLDVCVRSPGQCWKLIPFFAASKKLHGSNVTVDDLVNATTRILTDDPSLESRMEAWCVAWDYTADGDLHVFDTFLDTSGHTYDESVPTTAQRGTLVDFVMFLTEAPRTRRVSGYSSTAQFVNSISGIAGDGLQAQKQRSLCNIAAESAIYAPFRFTPEQSTLLDEMGISHSLLDAPAHPHPVSKTIENWILYNHVRKILPPDASIIYMKPGKARTFLPQVNRPPINTINTPRDAATRYPTSRPNEYPHKDSTMAFVHDAIFHMPKRYLGDCFDRSDVLTTVLFTNVAPFEVSLRAPSCCSLLYDLTYFEDKPDSFLFHLEGKQGDKYEQSIEQSLFWPTTRSFFTPQGKQIFVESVANYGAHHLFAATTLAQTADRYTGWSLPTLAWLPTLRNAKVTRALLPLEQLKNLALWARSVKAINPQAVALKLRQSKTLLGSPHLDELAINDLTVFLVDYSAYPLLVEGELDGTYGLFEQFLRWCRRILAYFSERHIRQARQRAASRKAFRAIPTILEKTDSTLLFPELPEELEGAGCPDRLLAARQLLTWLVDHCRSFCRWLVSHIRAGRPRYHEPTYNPKFARPAALQAKRLELGLPLAPIVRPPGSVPTPTMSKHDFVYHTRNRLVGLKPALLAELRASRPELEGAGLLSFLQWLWLHFTGLFVRAQRPTATLKPMAIATNNVPCPVTPPLDFEPAYHHFRPAPAAPQPALRFPTLPASPPGFTKRAFNQRTLKANQLRHKLASAAREVRDQMTEVVPDATPISMPPPPGFEPPLPPDADQILASLLEVEEYADAIKFIRDIDRNDSTPLAGIPLLPDSLPTRASTPSAGSTYATALESDMAGAPWQGPPPRPMGYPLILVPGKHLHELPDGQRCVSDCVVPEFSPGSLPMPKSGLCLLECLSEQIQIPVAELWLTCQYLLTRKQLKTLQDHPAKFSLSTHTLRLLAFEFALHVTVWFPKAKFQRPAGVSPYYGKLGGRPVSIAWDGTGLGHFSSFTPPAGSNVRKKIPLPPSFARSPLGAPAGKTLTSLAERLESELKFHDFELDIGVAKKYARDVALGKVGTLEYSSLLNNEKKKQLQAIAETAKSCRNRLKVRATVITGCAGSAKTTGLLNILKEKDGQRSKYIRPGQFKWSAPRLNLRNETAEKLDCDEFAYMVQTMEKSAIAGTGKVAFFDEAYLYNPGLIEFHVLLDPGCTHIVLLGDPAQNESYVRSAEASTKELPTYQEVFAPLIDSYRLVAYRNCAEICARLGLPTPLRKPGKVTHSRMPVPNAAVVHPVTDAVHVAQGRGAAYTYGTCQGCDWKKTYNLVITRETIFTCSDQSIYTAATRNCCSVNIVHQYPFSEEYFDGIMKRPLLAAIMGFGPPILFAAHFASIIGNNCVTPTDATIPEAEPSINPKKTNVTRWIANRQYSPEIHGAGTTYSPREDVLERAPCLSTYMTWFRDSAEAFEAIEPQLPVERDANLIACAPEQAFLPCVPELDSRESRELHSTRFGMSNQFVDYPRPSDDPDIWHIRSYFMKHSASDETTFEASIKKRIQTTTAPAIARRMKAATWTGAALFESFCDLYKLDAFTPIPFDPELFGRCIADNEEAKLSKGVNQLARNEGRADPDWDPRHVELFLKSQTKAKLETLAAPAKAGQIITLMGDCVVMTLGPLARYVSAQVAALRPANIYSPKKKTPQDLADFCDGRWRSGNNSECDFSYFDQSQDENTLLFEQMLFEYLSLPYELIQLYTSLKTSATCFLGHLPVIRFSGDVFTYDGNTLFTEVYMNLRFQLKEGLEDGLAGTSGDDFASDFPLVERPTWRYFEDKFRIETKLHYLPNATFCSYILTPKGSFKNPLLLNLKIWVARAERRVDKIAASYFLEHSLAHSKLDSLLPFMTPNEFDCHHENDRFFTRHRKLIPFFSIMSETFARGVVAQLIAWRDRNLYSSLLADVRKQDFSRIHSFAHLHGVAPFLLSEELIRLSRF